MIIGIGCDIVKIERIEKAMSHEGFLRILTHKEYELYQGIQGKRQIEWLAGRYAAKEAIYKAIHTYHDCVLSDIEILCNTDGSPVCQCFDCEVLISISHEHEYAIAYATAVSKE